MPTLIFDIPEVRASIASQLSSHDLTLAIRANKQWFEWFTPALWKRVVEFSFRPMAPPKPSDIGFKEGLAKYGHWSLQSLTISTEHRLEAYLEHCRHLLDLRLFFPYDLKEPASPDQLNRLVSLNPLLQSLAITAPLFVIEHAYFAPLNALTTLYLNRTFVNVHELVRILAYTPHLSNLGFREVIFGPRLTYLEDIDEDAFTAQLATHLRRNFNEVQPQPSLNPPKSSSAEAETEAAASPMGGLLSPPPPPSPPEVPPSSPSLLPILPWKEYPRLRELSFWTPMESLDLWILCRLLEQTPRLRSLTVCLGEEYGLCSSVCRQLAQHVPELQQLTLSAASPLWDDLSVPAVAAMVAACRAKPLESLSLHDYVNNTTTSTTTVSSQGSIHYQQYHHHNQDNASEGTTTNSNNVAAVIEALPPSSLSLSTPAQLQMETFAATLQQVRLYNFQEAGGTWFPHLTRECRRLRVLDMRFPLSTVPFREVAMATWNCRLLQKLDLVVGFESMPSSVSSASSMPPGGENAEDEGEDGYGDGDHEEEEMEPLIDQDESEHGDDHNHDPAHAGRRRRRRRRSRGDVDRAVLEHIFFEKLSNLTQLKELNLKGPRGYKGKSTDHHLDLTLDSGLGLLKDLGEMREFRVVSMNHAIGSTERQWMATYWPRLRVCEICASEA
ncbi:hypothetical protein DFQ26_007963 [Actinomortierella ambigua]|nr:hypothetical protein DFQ26_007963 [Actinomortierella ambigua]